MPSDLASYLAANYLVADPKPKSKKRKRKDAEAQGLLITDDDDAGWSKTSSRGNEGDDGPVTVSGTSAEFRHAKQSAWKTVGAQPTSKKPAADDEAAADAILNSAAAENEAVRRADDEMPVVEGGGDGDGLGPIKMSDGTHAGLQTAASVAAQLKRRQREERDEFERYKKERGSKEEETIYRDATGRRVDVSMKRAEARRAALEAEEKERRAKEALKGEVQVEEARRRREELEEAKFMTVARRADDEDMNKEMKEQQRWNDPMMQFMGEKKSSESGAKGTGKKGKARPVYSGAAQPNRYGIRPGYRWDGVDRGNGFEAERFKALNRRERNRNLDYSWQMDE